MAKQRRTMQRGKVLSRTRSIGDLYHQISVSYDGVNFAPYPAHYYMPLVRAFRRQSVQQWAVYGDIGGTLPDGETFITERVMLACSRKYLRGKSR